MVKLSTLLCAYLRENPQLKKKTKDGKQRAFVYFKEIIGDKVLEKLTVDDCYRYRNGLLAQRLARSSANIYMRDISSVLEWAVRVKQLLERNPMRQVRQLKTSRKVTMFDNEQFWKLIDMASRIWRARLHAGRLGLRRGEVLNLTKDDIRDGYIFIQPKKTSVDTWAWEPKSSENRAVPLSEELTGLLEGLDVYYPCLSKRLLDNNLILQDKGLLTECRRDCPDQNFNRDFRKLQLRAFDKIIGRFHDLRATFVTSSLEAGIPIHVVQSWAGHRRIETTMTYYSCVRPYFAESQREILENSLKRGLPKGDESDQTHCQSTPAASKRLGGTGLEPVTSCV